MSSRTINYIVHALVATGLIICTNASMAMTPTDQQLAAHRVIAGRAKTVENLKSCEVVFRNAGFDPRYIKQFWESRRFEIFEGVRITLESSIDPASPNAQIQAGSKELAPETCLEFVKSGSPGAIAIEGVAMADLKMMAEVYEVTHPDPRAKRDRSLFNDCIKANFNTRQPDFAVAVGRCNCVGEAMRTVPHDDLDNWLERAHRGEAVPMQQQPWFGLLALKLQACYAN